jgi:ribonucleotide reductase alpha subunit
LNLNQQTFIRFNGAKGTFIVKNPELEAVLEAKGKNNSKVWDQILADNGSVQNLPHEILADEEKEVFLTFPEINQLALVQQAAIRQKYIDQTQSLNFHLIQQIHQNGLIRYIWKLGNLELKHYITYVLIQ